MDLIIIYILLQERFLFCIYKECRFLMETTQVKVMIFFVEASQGRPVDFGGPVP